MKIVSLVLILLSTSFVLAQDNSGDSQSGPVYNFNFYQSSSVESEEVKEVVQETNDEYDNQYDYQFQNEKPVQDERQYDEYDEERPDLRSSYIPPVNDYYVHGHVELDLSDVIHGVQAFISALPRVRVRLESRPHYYSGIELSI